MNDLPYDGCGALLDKVRALAPVVAQYRMALDQERRLPVPLFNAIADAGLLRLWLPKTHGGPELSPLDFMTVVEAVSALDGSVGWIVGNGAGMSRAAGYLAKHVAAKLFADPRAFIVAATGATGDAVPAPGGYRVTGRWPFGSGIHHATDIMVHCRVADGRDVDAAPTMLMCHCPAGTWEIIDNWHVSGLRGSGSCDFTVTDVFVPRENTFPFPDTIATEPGPVYRLPAVSVFSWTVSTVPLGIARGALDAFAALAARNVRRGNARPLREQEVVQSEFGRAETSHAAARALMREAMTELVDALSSDDARLLVARAKFRMSCVHAGETAIEITNKLASLAGTASMLESGPLERYVRDASAAARHIAMSPQVYVTAGRLALGLELGSGRV